MKIITTESPLDEMKDVTKGIIHLTLEQACILHYHSDHVKNMQDNDTVFYHVPEFDEITTMHAMSDVYQNFLDSSDTRDHIPCYDFLDRAHQVVTALEPYITEKKHNHTLVYIDSISNFFLNTENIKEDYFLFKQRYEQFGEILVLEASKK